MLQGTRVARMHEMHEKSMKIVANLATRHAMYRQLRNCVYGYMPHLNIKHLAACLAVNFR